MDAPATGMTMGCRHDVYIVEGDAPGEYSVRPGTFAVDGRMRGIRFRNLTDGEARLAFPDSLFSPPVLTLAAGEGGMVLIEWDNARTAGAFPYGVTVSRAPAQGNSEPTIIIDL